MSAGSQLRRQRLTVIAGAGVYLRQAMPHPLKRGGTTVGIAEGRLDTVLNVFTEPEWRRRGVAALLMQRIIKWSRDERLDGLTLHAADAGRTLTRSWVSSPRTRCAWPIN